VLNVSLVTSMPKFASRLADQILGHWQASGIFTASNGSPLTITSGVDNSLTGVGADRPNVVGNGRLDDPTLRQWFNTSAFVKNGPGAYGNAGPGLLTGPGRWNLDAAVWRTFRFGERVRTDVRWEAFNVLNHARFNNPGTSLNTGNTFGVISSAQDPRIMQAALKLTF